MPDTVRIVEVGPRDGLQNEPTRIDLPTKHEYIRRLVHAGLTEIEATAFVSPRAVPQLADAKELMTLLDTPDWRDVTFPVLVPNMRGYTRAREAGATAISLFTAASETFNQRNINASINESIERFREVVEAATVDGVSVRGYVSMAFGCPWEGAIAPGKVLDVVRSLVGLGITDISLGDTIGVAVPSRVRSLISTLTPEIDIDRLGLHLHDTRGTSIACVREGLNLGIRTYDASTGGVGGCPFADGATGNLATEDLVWFLHEEGLKTSVDLEQLISTARWICDRLGRPYSHIAAAPLVSYS